jgi:hypothetical protein
MGKLAEIQVNIIIVASIVSNLISESANVTKWFERGYKGHDLQVARDLVVVSRLHRAKGTYSG